MTIATELQVFLLPFHGASDDRAAWVHRPSDGETPDSTLGDVGKEDNAQKGTEHGLHLNVLLTGLLQLATIRHFHNFFSKS